MAWCGKWCEMIEHMAASVAWSAIVTGPVQQEFPGNIPTGFGELMQQIQRIDLTLNTLRPTKKEHSTQARNIQR